MFDNIIQINEVNKELLCGDPFSYNQILPLIDYLLHYYDIFYTDEYIDIKRCAFVPMNYKLPINKNVKCCESIIINKISIENMNFKFCSKRLNHTEIKIIHIILRNRKFNSLLS